MTIQYVACAYKQNPELSVSLVQNYLNQQFNADIQAFSPVTMFHEQYKKSVKQQEFTPVFWNRLCSNFLRTADELVVLLGEFSSYEVVNSLGILSSTGVLAEIALAKMLEIPITYMYYSTNSAIGSWVHLSDTEIAYITKRTLEKESQ